MQRVPHTHEVWDAARRSEQGRLTCPLRLIHDAKEGFQEGERLVGWAWHVLGHDLQEDIQSAHDKEDLLQRQLRGLWPLHRVQVPQAPHACSGCALHCVPCLHRVLPDLGCQGSHCAGPCGDGCLSEELGAVGDELLEFCILRQNVLGVGQLEHAVVELGLVVLGPGAAGGGSSEVEGLVVPEDPIQELAEDFFSEDLGPDKPDNDLRLLALADVGLASKDLREEPHQGFGHVRLACPCVRLHEVEVGSAPAHATDRLELLVIQLVQEIPREHVLQAVPPQQLLEHRRAHRQVRV